MKRTGASTIRGERSSPHTAGRPTAGKNITFRLTYNDSLEKTIILELIIQGYRQTQHTPVQCSVLPDLNTFKHYTHTHTHTHTHTQGSQVAPPPPCSAPTTPLWPRLTPATDSAHACTDLKTARSTLDLLICTIVLYTSWLIVVFNVIF